MVGKQTQSRRGMPAVRAEHVKGTAVGNLDGSSDYPGGLHFCSLAAGPKEKCIWPALPQPGLIQTLQGQGGGTATSSLASFLVGWQAGVGGFDELCRLQTTAVERK